MSFSESCNSSPTKVFSTILELILFFTVRKMLDSILNVRSSKSKIMSYFTKIFQFIKKKLFYLDLTFVTIK